MIYRVYIIVLDIWVGGFVSRIYMNDSFYHKFIGTSLADIT